MAHISEHHSKEEWEGHYCQISRVSFLVARDTVGVHNPLKYLRKFVRLDIRRPRYVVVFVLCYTHCFKLRQFLC